MEKLEKINLKKFHELNEIEKKTLNGGSTTYATMPTYYPGGSKDDTSYVDDSSTGPILV